MSPRPDKPHGSGAPGKGRPGSGRGGADPRRTGSPRPGTPRDVSGDEGRAGDDARTGAEARTGAAAERDGDPDLDLDAARRNLEAAGRDAAAGRIWTPQSPLTGPSGPQAVPGRPWGVPAGPAHGASGSTTPARTEAGRAEAAGDLQAELATARRERDEYLDMVRRVQAEFENYKKRMLRQQTDHLERAAEGLVTKLLPALDAFDLARAHLEGADDLSPDGKALLQASALLGDVLAKEGLERIDEPGVEFDPTTHEAVEHQPGGDDGHGKSGPVVSGVLRSGYRWKGRVIRPAMVQVRG